MRSPLAAPLVLGMAIVVSAACAPALGGDGFYLCARTGRCPTTAPYCHPDGFCRIAPPTTGDAGADAGGEDAGTVSYDDCTDTPCAASGEECYRFAILDLADAGYCTHACATDAECPPYMGADSVCGPTGLCLRGCTGRSDCPDPFECISGRWGETARLSAACADQQLYAPLSQYDICATDTECVRPFECIGGRCLRHCGAAAPRCSELERCETTTPDGAVCLFKCGAAADIGCDALTEIACAGGACRPTSW